MVWPPEPVVFGPNPVEGVAISYVNGQARLRLKVSGPVTEDAFERLRAAGYL